ncbi:MAG: hypothetical protein E7442_07050 [Ruminococcaceae bacterium]|nr:hypothetical protein [Oscillospiraceae bacterium]
MKRVVAMMLLTVLLAFAGCGSDVGESEVAATEKKAAETPVETPVKEKSGAVTLTPGQKSELGFASFEFTDAVVDYKIGTQRNFIPGSEGMTFFAVQGNIKNTGGAELPISNFKAELVFNGEFTYTASATVIYGEKLNYTLPPLTEGRYIIYAEVPEALLEQLKDCTLRLAVNEDFASMPENSGKGDYCFELYLDESICAAAAQGPVRELQYFAECPILPTPMSYVDLFQSGSSTSSSNGKVTSIKYNYSAGMGSRVDMKEAYTTYINALQEAGFTVQVGEGNEIYSGAVKVATMFLSGDRIEIRIVPGNEGLTAPAAGEAGDSSDKSLALGEAIETDYAYMLLDQFATAAEIRSGSNNYGMYEYYSSENGDPYFYLSGSFKNLGGAPVDLINTYVTFTFDDKYTFKGQVDGYAEGNNNFIRDVSPLSEVKCYVHAAVPQELIDSYSSCVVRIGFTRNFDYKVVDVNDLPKMENCDDVFAITLK